MPPPKPRVAPPRLLTDEYTPAATKAKEKREAVTATWKMNHVDTHDYKTVLAHTFNDKEHGLLNVAPKAKSYNTQRLEMRTFAVDRLRATAAARYGSVADLFHAVRLRAFSFIEHTCR